MEDTEFIEFQEDLNTCYSAKQGYENICKTIDDYYGGRDKVPEYLDQWEIPYDAAVENLVIVEDHIFNKWKKRFSERLN